MSYSYLDVGYDKNLTRLRDFQPIPYEDTEDVSRLTPGDLNKMIPSQSIDYAQTNLNNFMTGEDMQSSNFVSGSAGWQIKGNGDVEFNDGVFRGSLTATTIDIGGSDSTSFHVDIDGNMWLGAATFASGTFKVSNAGVLTATSGTIGGWTIGSATLTGGSATLDSTGVLTLGTTNDVVILSASDATYRLWIGNATAASGPFRVTKAGVVTATDITATGTINAIGGYIGASTALPIESGGFNTGTTGHIRGGQTAYSTGTGYFLGYESAAYKFSIGDGGTTYYMEWDGATLTVNGSNIAEQTDFGDGSDGPLTISSDTTLTSDIFPSTLVVDAGFNYDTGGYHGFAKTSAVINGTYRNNGGNGGAGTNAALSVAGTGGTAGAASAGGTLAAGLAGRAGGNGGAGKTGTAGAGSAGSAGAAGINLAAGGIISAGNAGRSGATGGDSGAHSQSGGNGGGQGAAGSYVAAVSRPYANPMSVYLGYHDSTGAFIQFNSTSGNGGTGGGGGGASNGDGGGGDAWGGGGGGGGGGGANGGITFLSARSITIGAAGSIQALGGNGGNGGNGANATIGAGSANPGGGGPGSGGDAGNGGIVVLTYVTLTNNGSISAAAGSIGTAGTAGTNGGGTGFAGIAGDDGRVGIAGKIIQLQV